jgi:PilZ domain-containing protein
MTTQPADKEAAKAERRQFQRRKYRGKLEMEWGSIVLTGDVRDLAPGGLFVELVPPLWVGAAFRARLMVNPALLLDCTVVRVEPGKGMGVTFVVVKESGKPQLDALLQSLPPV